MNQHDFKIISEHIKEINKIVESCSDSVKEKCFEMLFGLIFSESGATPQQKGFKSPDIQESAGGSTSEKIEKKVAYKLPPNVLAFARKYDIFNEDIEKLFILDHEPLLPVYKINSRKIARAQLQKVMMVLFENGLLNNQLKAPYQELRDSCKEDGFFDSNFNKMLKSHSKLFKGAIRSDKIVETEIVELTGLGYEELAKIIKELGAPSSKKDE